MAEEKVVVTLDNFEQRLMVSGLADFRNDLLHIIVRPFRIFA